MIEPATSSPGFTMLGGDDAPSCTDESCIIFGDETTSEQAAK